MPVQSKQQDSAFRHWLHELWLQNSDEQRDYGQLPYTQEEYFKRYKYWLKREYKHQLENSNVR